MRGKGSFLSKYPTGSWVTNSLSGFSQISSAVGQLPTSPPCCLCTLIKYSNSLGVTSFFSKIYESNIKFPRLLIILDKCIDASDPSCLIHVTKKLWIQNQQRQLVYSACRSSFCIICQNYFFQESRKSCARIPANAGEINSHVDQISSWTRFQLSDSCLEKAMSGVNHWRLH